VYVIVEGPILGPELVLREQRGVEERWYALVVIVHVVEMLRLGRRLSVSKEAPGEDPRLTVRWVWTRWCPLMACSRILIT